MEGRGGGVRGIHIFTHVGITAGNSVLGLVASVFFTERIRGCRSNCFSLPRTREARDRVDKEAPNGERQGRGWRLSLSHLSHDYMHTQRIYQATEGGPLLIPVDGDGNERNPPWRTVPPRPEAP